MYILRGALTIIYKYMYTPICVYACISIYTCIYTDNLMSQLAPECTTGWL